MVQPNTLLVSSGVIVGYIVWAERQRLNQEKQGMDDILTTTMSIDDGSSPNGNPGAHMQQMLSRWLDKAVAPLHVITDLILEPMTYFGTGRNKRRGAEILSGDHAAGVHDIPGM